MTTRAATVELEVESVGIRGDGVARYEGERVYLPLAAPGDRVRVRLGDRHGGKITELLEAGARAEPVCPHFGACGGCALQHLSAAAYEAAKLGWLAEALRRHGLEAAKVAPLRRLRPGTRRRARFAIRRPRGAAAAAEIGFHARASHDIVDMWSCAVLEPALVALLPPLRSLARELWRPGESGAASATVADEGIDLLLDLAAEPGLAGLEAMAGFAAAQNLARLSWRAPDGVAVPAAQHRPVRITFAGVPVDLPEPAFLQASAEADQALTETVVAHLGEARRIADLFAGVGTFSFALARIAAVHAVESAPEAAAALAAAARRAALGGRVTCETRDLHRRPLAPEELAPFDAVVFDPPRAGAAAQCRALSASHVRRVVAVSCNPATFARDARTLVDGGYRLVAVQPIDSFVWSAHLELVALLERR